MEILDQSPRMKNRAGSDMKEKYPALGDYLTVNTKRKYDDGMSTEKLSMIEQIMASRSSSLLSNSHSVEQLQKKSYNHNVNPSHLNLQVSTLNP